MSVSPLHAMPAGAPSVVPMNATAAKPPAPAAEAGPTVMFGDQYLPSKGTNITHDEYSINFNQPVTSQTAGALIAGLNKVAEIKKQLGGSIKLLLNTPGGDAHAGMQAANFIKGLTVPVDTVVLGGQAASMGSLLFLTGTGRRVMTTDSSLMIHEPRMMFQNAQMTATQMHDMGDNAMRMKRQMDRLISKVTELPLDAVAKMTEKDTHVYPLEALRKGFATHVLLEDDLTQAVTPETLKGMSDKEIERRDREHDYDGLKTETFDPQIQDENRIAQLKAAQQRRGAGFPGMPPGFPPMGAMMAPEGHSVPESFSARGEDSGNNGRPRMVLMA